MKNLFNPKTWPGSVVSLLITVLLAGGSLLGMLGATFILRNDEKISHTYGGTKFPSNVVVLTSEAYGAIALGCLLAALIGFTAAGIFHTLRDSFWERETAQTNLDRALKELIDPNDLIALMNVNRRQMEAYDIQARTQGKSSHWSSLAAMAAGLIVVGVGLWIAVNADDSATKYAAAIVAAVGTATGGYIARTFIRVNTDAQQHVRYYFEQPLVQSYILTAERIVRQLPDDRQPDQYEAIINAALNQAGLVPELRSPAAETVDAPTEEKAEQNTQPDEEGESDSKEP